MVDKVSAKFIEMVEECANTPEYLEKVRGRWMERVPIQMSEEYAKGTEDFGEQEYLNLVVMLENADHQKTVLYKGEWMTPNEYWAIKEDEG